VGLERGPLSHVWIIEELLEWKSSGSGSRKPRLTAMEIRCADHATPSIRKKVALTSPTSGGRSVGIVRFWTKATEFNFLVKSLKGIHGISITCSCIFQSTHIKSDCLPELPKLCMEHFKLPLRTRRLTRFRNPQLIKPYARYSFERRGFNESYTYRNHKVHMESLVFWDITPCSPLKISGRFWGTYRLQLQGRRRTRTKRTWNT
jgi:hypothetical protein